MREVIVVGAGPTGLMLAGELALAGVDVEVLERRSTAELVGTRARGFHARTIEILDQRGIADRFLAEGQTVPRLAFGATPLEIGELPTRHPYTLGLGQAGIEEILLGWVEELGVSLRRGVEVTGFGQDDQGVDVHLAGGTTARTAWLVGADGGRSVVRKAAGIEMVGAEPTRSLLIGEVAVTQELPEGIRLDEVGIHALSAMPDGTAGFVVTEPALSLAAEPTLEELRAALVAAFGTDLGAHEPRWMSRFTDATRQVVDYRRGRVLVAGDAAHVHPPTGGQGVGLGVQDAVNLGWKLGQVVRGDSPEGLLDTYRAERHPATARVLANVTTQAMMQRGDARTSALRETVADLLADPGTRARMAALLTGLDVALDLGEGHPLLGRRMPDLDLVTAAGPTRVCALLHDARAVLLDLAGGLEPGRWGGRVRHVAASAHGPWELPGVGPVPAPAGVLIRPDGHVAWVGDGTDAGLREALTSWCGPA